MNTKRIDILKSVEMFRDIDDVALAELASHAIEKELDRNEILFLGGERAAGLFVIASGSVRAFRSGIDGREQVIHVEKAITTIAEVPVFDDGNYPSTVAAEEPTKVLFLPKEYVRAACLAHPQLALAAARLLASRLRNCAELVESLSLREVGQRLARLLVEESEERGTGAGASIKFRQKLTHNQLAARVGTVREVITRVLYRMQAQGLVIVDGKDVVIPDLPALRRYAEM